MYFVCVFLCVGVQLSSYYRNIVYSTYFVILFYFVVSNISNLKLSIFNKGSSENRLISLLGTTADKVQDICFVL